MKPTFLVLIFFLSANFIFAQEESFDDFLESDDDFGLDFEDEEFSLDGEEMFDDEFSDDEFGDDEFGDDEFSIDDSFASSETLTLEQNYEGDTRTGYSVLVSGGIPVFRNSTLLDWNGSPSGISGRDHHDSK